MTEHAYTKVYRSITQSTVWVGQPAHVKLAWIVLLAEADEIGRVTTPVPVLAKLAEVTIAELEEALGVFLAPDPYSRSKEHEGRRIEPLDGDEEFGGFRILNHDKYRQRRDADRRKEQNREAQARWRERNPKTAQEVSADVSERKQDKPESADLSHKKPIPSASSSACSLPSGDPDLPDRLGTTARETSEPAPPKPDLAREVFDHWASTLWPKVHPDGRAPKASDDRMRVIRARLADGYTVAQLRHVVDRVAKTPFYLGDNERRTAYIEPKTIMRSASKVDELLSEALPGMATSRNPRGFEPQPNGDEPLKYESMRFS